ncbi:MAG: peptidoglycan DD-metalloendopeptidase family protein [Candidatus Paceibacterota bacterium]
MIKFHKTSLLLIVIFLISYLLPLTSTISLHAQTASDIQAKIDQRNADIANLEKEIASYQKQIDALSTQTVSLVSTIKTLELTRKKLEKNISLTQDKIASKNYEIQRLGSQITGKESNISDNQRIIAKTFSTINESGSQSLPELILSSRSVSQTIDSFEQLNILQQGLYDRIKELSQDKANLETNKKASEKAKAELVKLNNQLSDQRALVLSTSAEQTALLKETSQSEANYKKILAQKKAQEAAFQQEINSYESQLNLLIHPNLIPHTGSGVLSWPLDKITVTQYFGNTPFATANPQVYNGRGHTGIDFRASIGTPVKAALSGTIIGVGDTDIVRSCYSYGKWVMIKHANGLSTLYAHLSLQNVIKGQTVSTGDMLGYSGNTGYSTGPHLHFGVYATEGVQIKRFDNSVNCRGVVIPTADYKAYLNPLSYL